MNPTQLRLRPILVTSGLLLVLWSVSRQPNWVEGAYATRIYPWIIAILIRLTGWFPFSLAEAVIVLALLGMVGYSLWRMFQLSKGREWRARVILRMVGDGLLLGLVVILLGYALWGLNYARPALAERLGEERILGRDSSILTRDGQIHLDRCAAYGFLCHDSQRPSSVVLPVIPPK